MSHNLLRQSIKNVHRALVNREITVAQLCQESFKQIEATKNLNAFITTCQQEALSRAHRLDEQLLNSLDALENNPLFGLPISVKDNFCTRNVLTTCGSKMLHNFVPPYTATAVQKLSDAHCINVGKTNMDEFAMGSSCTTSYFGQGANYWRSDGLEGRLPSESRPENWFMAGGSSTGSAISVASGACFASLGTDTGGSTRQPASLAGVVGFKPTYGLVSRHGLIPLAHCLDVVSILTRSVDDAQLIFETIVGQDSNDMTSVDHRAKLKTRLPTSLALADGQGTIKIRVGIPEQFITKGDISRDVATQFDKVLSLLSSNKKICDSVIVELVDVRLPGSKLATECYTIVSSAEIASNMSCYDGLKYGYTTNPDEARTSDGAHFDRDLFYRRNRDESLGAEVKKRILLGNYFLLEQNREKYLVQAQRVRRMISDEFMQAFEEQEIDILLLPSTPTTSITYADWLKKQDDNKLFHEDYFLIPANLASLPAISVPSGRLSSSGLPVGFQVVANKFCDLDLLRLAGILEREVLRNI